MKMLLTSGGVSNASIETALVELLGKPISEADALVIPTAIYAVPDFGSAYRIVTGTAKTPLAELGWKSLGLLELTALPSIDAEAWKSKVRETDALLVSGGDPIYLAHWVRESGLLDLVPELVDQVWVGVSAGSLVMAPRIGDALVEWQAPTGDQALGLVDFAMLTHVDHPLLPDNTMADAERWAASMDVPAYAIDDETAIRVVDGTVDVISEGHWRLF
ncbi:Type 1 glutamine amidotransferase-like domain-containing protein [Frondihabitans australicus]|uniref:Dipeptidase E n=1 Tax=Frondihabitans australicus TaxID=386892 RepID=A0A495IIS0_9MICO|nr:Type 1 glutamine amidotransferase-like domain-containing protein [Frondihabitans australicus]RKR75922.1 dipeptidase E [Frondihabitans australicus]